MSKSSVFIVAPEYYGIEDSIRAAFEKAGFKASLLRYKPNLSMPERVVSKIIRLFPLLERILVPFFILSLLRQNADLIKAVRNRAPDMLFIIKGEFILPGTVRLLSRKMGILTISYQWDDPFYSHEDHKFHDRYRRENFLRSAGLYDHVFIFDSHYVRVLKQKGFTSVDFLPLATDPDIYRLQNTSEEERKQYSYDICFVGAPFKNRVRLFNRLRGFNLGVFGSHWDNTKYDIKWDYFKGPARGETVNKLYSTSKIVLNIHHPQSVAGVNTRTFDIPACGAFEMVDFKEDLERLFKIGDEIVCYKDDGELLEKIEYYLKNPNEMKRIAENGRKRVMNEHTWLHRVCAVVDVLQKNQSIDSRKRDNLPSLKRAE